MCAGKDQGLQMLKCEERVRGGGVTNASSSTRTRGGAPRIDRLLRLTANDMDAVNALILEKASSHVALIPKLAERLVVSGGKRVRPMLTLACARICDYPGNEHIKLAAAVEFMHTATLLHDDVMDESDLRRGEKAAHLLWGNQASILVGDYLLGQAFRMMVSVGSLDSLVVLSDAAVTIAEGEVWQLSATRDTNTTEDDNLGVIRSKTASLFSAATEVGAVIAGAEEEKRTSLRSFGINFGIAFQLIDDALDYTGQSDTLGKTVGGDLREGKVTLPVILSYRRGNETERNFWDNILRDGQVTEEDLEYAIFLMRKYDTIGDTIERARLYGQAARESLDAFPNSAHKDALLDLIPFCIDRSH